ncbi:transmembrane protein 100-like [Gracilinanus agilis]|uniref:transmembrane protein 100-like n=1 Tax=Gracilinanus agilis TaxID=191870 RepID=UPI001CFEC2BE|nr:transmembrane protein 100-like [Gracilinanus agilis]
MSTPTCAPASEAGLPPAPTPATPAPALGPAGPLHTLALATGGAGSSWHRCIFPFGAVSTLVGAAATGITFSLRGPRLDLAQGVSVAALGSGLGLLTAAFLCWRARRGRRRQRERDEEPRTP